MEDADGYFPERVAATYDDSADGMFDPAFTATVAEVLPGFIAGGWNVLLAPNRRLVGGTLRAQSQPPSPGTNGTLVNASDVDFFERPPGTNAIN